MPLQQIQTEIIPGFTTMIVDKSLRLHQVAKAVPQGFVQIRESIKAQGLEPAGAPYIKYMDMDWDQQMSRNFFQHAWAMLNERWPIEIGVPVSGGRSTEELRVIREAEFRAVTALHVGHYNQLSAAYQELYTWIKGQGYQLTRQSYEIYLEELNYKGHNKIRLVVPILGK